MSGVELRGVRKTYGSFVAVDGIDLRLGEDEFAVLVGPSGCGKSTTLRMVAGLEDISGGEIWIGDREASRLSPADRDIAMVFQNYALYPNMSVRANMAFGLENRRTPKAKIVAEIERAAKVLDISHLLDRKPRQLSGGQQQRVALGRCLVRHPKVFLFDEPLSNLDAKLRLEMRQELKRLRSRIDATSMYVTHDQVEAMTLGDRVIVMDGGAIRQVGTPSEIYHRPAHTFVASFMGSPAMNFLDGQLSDDGHRIDGKGFSLPLNTGDAAALRHRGIQSVRLGIRPEDVEIAPNADQFPGAVVDLTEMLGAEQVVETRVGGARFSVSRVDPLIRITSGERIGMKAHPDRLHFFDPDDGKRIEAPSAPAVGALGEMPVARLQRA